MKNRVHIVALPFPLQGHIAPMLHLIHKILSTMDNMIVSFVTFDSHKKVLLESQNKWYLDNIKTSSELRIVGLPDEGVPRNKSGEWIDGNGNWRGNLDAVYTALEWNMKMIDPLKNLLQQENEDIPRASCIIADSTCLWIPPLCAELGVPFVGLWSSSAAFLLVYLNLRLLFDKGYIPLKGGKFNERVVEDIPGLTDVQVTDLPFSVHKEDPRDPSFSLAYIVLDFFKQSKLALVNSCEQLEGATLSAVREIIPHTIPIGPLLKKSNSSAVGLWVQNRDCIDWLDCRENSSVIYVSFGSLCEFTFEAIRSIADGIEASGKYFLWVVREGLIRGIPRDFFEGFVGRTKERGLVISWAPQVEVLEHKSVVGFLTHCGWNSCLEAITAGVPMLTYPSFADQNLNAKVVCDDLGIGMRLIPKGEVGGFVGKGDVETGIRDLIEGDKGREMRERALLLKESIETGCNGFKGLKAFLTTFY